MYCKNCGKKIESDAKFCNECGTKVTVSKNKEAVSEPVQVEVVREVPISNSKGVASLVLGIISLFFGFFLVPLPIIGLILGIVQQKKNGVAIAGIIINVIALAGTILLWILVIITVGVSTNDFDYHTSSYSSMYIENVNNTQLYC